MTLGLSNGLKAVGLLAALAAAGACGFDGAGSFSTDDDGDDDQDGDDDDGQDGGDDDGGIGGRPDAAPPDAKPDVCLSWVPGIPFTPCDILIGDRGGELVLDQTGTYNYDTEDGTLTPPGGGTPIEHQFQELTIQGNQVHFLSASNFRIEANAILRVQGPTPLLIASWSEIEIAGEIDASSSVSDGAAANSPDCGAGTGGEGRPRTARRRRGAAAAASAVPAARAASATPTRPTRAPRGSPRPAISVCAAAAPAARAA